MATFQKFNAFVADVHNGVHDLSSDQLTIALTNTAPTASDSVLTDLTEIDYTNLSSRNITVSSSTQTAGVYKCVVNDITLTSTGGSTGPFRYVSVYNNTPASNNLIAWADKGSSITLSDGESLDVDFDDANGFFQNT